MIVVDAEMSGLDTACHAIVSVGAIDFERPDRRWYRECRIWDGAEIDEEALGVNGFTRAHITDPDRMSEEALIREFIDWLKESNDRTIGGQNTATDRDFLQVAANRYGIAYRFGYRVVDLHSIAWAHLRMRGVNVPLKDGRTDLSADVIYPYVGLPVEPKPHHALTGALMEAEALSRFIYRRPLLDEFRSYPIPPQ
jgi:DNA polymerase III epsilon subunit-like protein